MHLQSVDFFPVVSVHRDIFIFHRSMAKREHVIFKIPNGEELLHSVEGNPLSRVAVKLGFFF